MNNSSNENNQVEPISGDELEKKLEALENWSLDSSRKIIFRSFEFDSFSESVTFVNRVANFSEEIKHYPYKVIVKTDKVEIKLTTSEIDGLSKDDFELAREIDFIAGWEVKFQSWLSSTKVIIVLLVLFGLVLFWRYFL